MSQRNVSWIWWLLFVCGVVVCGLVAKDHHLHLDGARQLINYYKHRWTSGGTWHLYRHFMFYISHSINSMPEIFVTFRKHNYLMWQYLVSQQCICATILASNYQSQILNILLHILSVSILFSSQTLADLKSGSTGRLAAIF